LGGGEGREENARERSQRRHGAVKFQLTQALLKDREGIGKPQGYSGRPGGKGCFVNGKGTKEDLKKTKKHRN